MRPFKARGPASNSPHQTYIRARIYLEVKVTTARVFKSGNSQAVRLPKEFRFDSSEVEIFRRGKDVVLREKSRRMENALDVLRSLPADMFDGVKDERAPQKRRGL